MNETHPYNPEQKPNRRKLWKGAGAVVGLAAVTLGSKMLFSHLVDSTADKAADNLWGQPDPMPSIEREYDPPTAPKPTTPSSARPTLTPSPSPSAAETPEFTWQSCEADAKVDMDTNSLLVEVNANYTGQLQANDLRIVALVQDHHPDQGEILFTGPAEEYADGQVEAELDSNGRLLPPAERTDIYMAEFPPDNTPLFQSGRDQPNPFEKLDKEYYTPCGTFSIAADGTVTPIDG